MTRAAPGHMPNGREPQMFGRYRMLGRIAAGGMAEVWAAQLLAPGGFAKAMVIKRVLPELASNPTFLRMLMTEARVAARLSHTNICSVFELGEVDGEYYIAMEYLRGAPLTSLLKQGGGLDPASAIAIVAQACDGLHYAHEQRDNSGGLLGLVHRDVSPHNLFITVDGVVKVLDFGIAKVDDGSSERTEAGKVKGKLAYMSPEQLAADQLDRRSDVWSLGCVLWELLTGRRLFAGGPAQTIDAIRNARVPLLAAAGVDLARLDDVIARAVCKNREFRYGSAADLRRAMVDALGATTPTQSDALSQLVWARCGVAIRAQDKRFENDPTGEEPALIDRLPLRAGTTQVSQEVYLDDGLETPELEQVLGELELHRAPTSNTAVSSPVAVRRKTTRDVADTSPEIPSAPSAIVDLAPRRRRGLVFGLIAVFAIAGMAAAYLLKRNPDAPAVAVIDPVRPAAPAAAPDIQPLPQPAPTPTPAVVPVPVPVAVPEADPVVIEAAPVVPAHKKHTTPAPVATPTPPKPRPVKLEPGKLYVDAAPWATIYVDGAKLGATPIVGETLDAGDHSIRAVTADGRSKTLKVHVDAGGTVRRKVTW